MSGIGKPESATQHRIIQLFQQELQYSFLGDWTDRAGNSNIEEGLLMAYIDKAGSALPRSAPRSIGCALRPAITMEIVTT